MQHFSRQIHTAQEISALFAEPAIAGASLRAKSLLVQIFANKSDPHWIREVTGIIHEHAPAAIIAGVASSGSICNGAVTQDQTVLSISCFDSTTLIPFALEVLPGKEIEAARVLTQGIHTCTELKGLLLFAPPLNIDAAALLRGLNEGNPGLNLFGGGAGQGAGIPSPVFLNNTIIEFGLVAVAFCGADLHIQVRTLFDWRPLGPSVRLTQVADGYIRLINDRPAFDLYRENLDIEAGEDLYLLEFPLLIERRGTVLARNPLSPETDGSIRIIADAYTGESARLGYLDVNALKISIRQTTSGLREFRPQGIYLYSCICRRFTLQEETEMETLPFQGIAPTTGFFTYGEFCNLNERIQVLNSSEVIVAIREGEGSELLPEKEDFRDGFPANPSRERHIRMTSRLFHFIAALTERIDAANQTLSDMANHDDLTGTYNRRALEHQLPLEIERAKRFNHPLSLLMLDLDLFKNFNDTFGHAAGDEVLINVTHLVREMLRSIDRLYRFGGEEFIVLLPETGSTGAVLVAENLRRRIADTPILFGGVPLPAVTASFGISTFPGTGTDAISLILSADNALYDSKAKGRNCVTVAFTTG